MDVDKKFIKEQLILLLKNFKISTIDVYCPNGNCSLRGTNGKSLDKFLMECKMTQQQLGNFRGQEAWMTRLRQDKV